MSKPNNPSVLFKKVYFQCVFNLQDLQERFSSNFLESWNINSLIFSKFCLKFSRGNFRLDRRNRHREYNLSRIFNNIEINMSCQHENAITKTMFITIQNNYLWNVFYPFLYYICLELLSADLCCVLLDGKRFELADYRLLELFELNFINNYH